MNWLYNWRQQPHFLNCTHQLRNWFFSINYYSWCAEMCSVLVSFQRIHKLCTRISFFFHHFLSISFFFLLLHWLLLLVLLCNLAWCNFFTIFVLSIFFSCCVRFPCNCTKFCNIFCTTPREHTHTHALTSRIFMICMLSYMCMGEVQSTYCIGNMRVNRRLQQRKRDKHGIKRIIAEESRHIYSTV